MTSEANESRAPAEAGSSGSGDIGDLAAQLHALRAALLETIEELPETRLYRATDRLGWTLKHELSSLAAADEELKHVLDRLRAGEATAELQLRRFRGERMWAAQELRLAPLRQHLAATGEQAVAAVRAHAEAFVDAPLRIAGRELATAGEYLRSHLEAARTGLQRIREAME